MWTMGWPEAFVWIVLILAVATVNIAKHVVWSKKVKDSDDLDN